MTDGLPGELGKLLIGVGLVLVLLGLVFLAAGRLGLGRLPGDIIWRRDNVTIYFPIMTSLILSLLLTLLLWIMQSFSGRS